MSLDDIVICAFGSIKFKVRVITKADWYGINIYVVTYAKTAFVLKVIIYTGRYTYFNNNNTDMMKTVKLFLNCVSHLMRSIVLFLFIPLNFYSFDEATGQIFT